MTAEKVTILPEEPINPKTVARCILSAQSLPLSITRSQGEMCAIFAFRALSRSRLTFSCGVSLGGARESSLTVDGILFDACGVTGVKCVGSDAFD